MKKTTWKNTNGRVVIVYDNGTYTCINTVFAKCNDAGIVSESVTYLNDKFSMSDFEDKMLADGYSAAEGEMFR